jgi:hypothetical protein
MPDPVVNPQGAGFLLRRTGPTMSLWFYNAPTTKEGVVRLTLVNSSASGPRHYVRLSPAAYPKFQYPYIKKITGVVKEETVPVPRKVRCYESSTGALVSEVLSKSDGTFEIRNLSASVEYDVVAQDSPDSPDFNNLIFSKIVPV